MLFSTRVIQVHGQLFVCANHRLAPFAKLIFNVRNEQPTSGADFTKPFWPKFTDETLFGQI
jgi:hypothetical protein